MAGPATSKYGRRLVRSFINEPPPDPSGDIERAVLKALEGVTRSRSLTREEVAHQAGLLVDGLQDVSDRQVRKAIENLRQTPDGCEIMSSSGWSGYWMLDSLGEWDTHYREERSRALNHMKRLRKQSILIGRARSREQ